jgi:hypothetical protein
MRKMLLALLCASSFAHAQISNQVANVVSSQTYTATTVNSGDQANFNFKGGQFVVNVSAYTSGTYTPHIQGKDPVSGVYYDILVGPAINATGMTILKIYPGIGVLANGSASDILPQTWRVQLVGASTPSMTLSVQAYLEP